MVYLNSLFGNRICWMIIMHFAENPKEEVSQTSVIQTLHISKRSAIKWLRFLEKNRIVMKREVGRTNLYRLNRSNTLVKQIKVLRTISTLLAKATRLEGAELYLFGSAARGEDDEKSDIDILLIGPDRSGIEELRRIDRRIKVTAFTPLEWSRMAREDPAFYERVEKDRILLVE